MRWFGSRHRHEEVEVGDVLTAEDFETVLEKRALTMLGMDLDEFKARLMEGELPESPAVDHLRFLLGV